MPESVARTPQLDTRSLEEELERLRPMAELGRLAATVAHEIRNPLAGISANAELLCDALDDPADKESVDMILAECQRLSNLVSDLLHYSREREARKDPLDLRRVASQVCDLLLVDAQSMKVDLMVQGEGYADGDPDLSRQSMLNIVRNAMQASPEGSVVNLVVEEGKVKVQDHGSGVPAALHETIFEPFVTGRTRGLGLGSAVAKRCMQRQGGNVVLEATDEHGSTFTLSWSATADIK